MFQTWNARTRFHAHVTKLCTIALAIGGLVEVADAGQIRWQTGTVTMTPRAPAELESAITALAARPGDKHVVVQFNKPLTKAERTQLEAAGIAVQSYLSDNAYFAKLTPAAANGAALAAATNLISDVRAIDRVWKLHPALARNEIPEWARLDKADADGKRKPVQGNDPVVAVIAEFHPDVDMLTQGVAIARGVGASVRSRLKSINSLVLELPLSQVTTLADHDGVMWIEPPLPPLTELNDSNRVRVGADTVNNPPYDLDGTGVTVLVYDSANVLASHSDMVGRVTVRDFEGTSDHSTHVAGTIGGDGAGSGGTFRGMAPGVIMESYGFDVPGGLQPGFLYTDPGDVEANYDEAINMHGVEISNNSIGSNVEPNGYNCAWQGDYGTTAQLIDSIVRGSLGSPFRIVWAAGNERQGSRCDVEGFGDYYSVAPPGCAKNHISVGAMNSNDDSVTSFTSWGPTDDGRLKPDLSGPGCQSNGDGGVTSTASSGGYNVKCGTSMAAPTVCGVGALFLQEWKNLYPAEPLPIQSTLKALLVHSCADIESTGPDYRSGYGSVRAPALIDLLRSGNFIVDEVAQGETKYFALIVNQGLTNAKITLVWDDAPGTPNVSPSLVNDLDLHVTSNNGATQHFPWTLDPQNPGAPAVQTQEDHLNNIEQVSINGASPGVYLVEVRGTNVPFGSQSFTVVGTPTLVACSSQGRISIDANVYACNGQVAIQVDDCDLNTDDLVVETVNIVVTSDSEPVGETIVLTETAAETAMFQGTIDLSTTDSSGVLQVAHGDTMTATYIDADDGIGGMNITITASAPVDCQAPVISNVQAPFVNPLDATVTFMTDEPAKSTIRYSLDCNNLDQMLTSDELQTSHTFFLPGLTDNVTYYYAVDAEDEATNSATDDNGGSCHSFTTPEVADSLTEVFFLDYDLANTKVEFTPNGTIHFYGTCATPITEFPTDPTGGTPISVLDDDFEQVDLTGGAVVSLYSVSYGTIYIGSNGYLTFTEGDNDYTETLAEHFAIPRVAGHYDDLSPVAGGTISYKQLADRMVVTWQDLPEYNVGGSNSFQIEMFFDGRITMSYLAMSTRDGICGLSQGLGLAPTYQEYDMTTTCALSLFGDFDMDGDVDLSDFSQFSLCFGGANLPPAASCPSGVDADADDDGDVDLGDFSEFSLNFTGPL